MKEYMKQRRKDNKFKKNELERKKSYNKKYKNLNPEKIKESWQKASATRADQFAFVRRGADFLGGGISCFSLLDTSP